MSTILSLHELVCFMILMNTHRQKKAKTFFEEDPKKWYHCRNTCISHVQCLVATVYVFADMSQQNWHCSDTNTVGGKDYPFLLYCFTNNTTVIVIPSMNWIRKEVHFTHSIMN